LSRTVHEWKIANCPCTVLCMLKDDLTLQLDA
jgi:hypothetical protein